MMFFRKSCCFSLGLVIISQVESRNHGKNFKSLDHLDLLKEFQDFKLNYNPFIDEDDLHTPESAKTPSEILDEVLRVSAADESTNKFLAEFGDISKDEEPRKVSMIQEQYGTLSENNPELSASELFDLETQKGLELLDDSLLKSTPDMVDIEYGDEFQGTFARRFGAVRSMLTELSCRSGKCTHSRKYLKALMDYGCNCYPRGKDNLLAYDGLELWHYASRGKPIDEVDKACKQAFVNYKCFDYDRENDEMTDNMTCRAGIPFKFHMKDGEIVCGPSKSPNYKKNQSQNQCKLAACQIERAFSYKVFEIIGNDPIAWRVKMKNNYFKLLPENGCEKVFRSVAVKKDQCCGEYPQRLPFNSLQHECCEGRFLSGIGTC